MMFRYSDEKLAILVGVPIVTIILIWTVVIFHKNRRRWGPYDVVIVSIMVQSIIRNLASVAYTTWLLVRQTVMRAEICSVTVWIFNSVHTFQASSLTTLAVVALFSSKLELKRANIRQYLMRTHIVYHMFCLTTLCACVGVAAILAQETPPMNTAEFEISTDRSIYPQCLFMPFLLDVKYSVFILTLHVFLAVVSATCLLWVSVIFVRVRRKNFAYLKKSSSDLSDLSLASMVNANENLHNNNNNNNQGKNSSYDSYTVDDKGCSYDCNCNCNVRGWSSDPSATVSSSNSRRPCLKGQQSQRFNEDDVDGTGLQTMYPVLTVCYLFNHLPVIVLCIFPSLIYPWPVAGAALWMAQLQDILIPIGLGLVDTRFCSWVTTVYKCSGRNIEDEKLPQVGLDGKFRHFESPPQSLEINHPIPERIIRAVQHTEHKFPITNGSLYTSIDGRLPIIHNYRRHNKNHQPIGFNKIQSANMDIHSSHLKKQEYVSKLENFPPQAINRCYRNNFPVGNSSSFDKLTKNDRISLNGNNSKSMLQHVHRDSFMLNSRPLQKRISLSHDSVRNNGNIQEKNWPSSSASKRRVLLDASKEILIRKSRSEDALNDLQKEVERFKRNPGFYEVNKENGKATSDFSSDEELTETGGVYSGQENDAGSQSGYSITTDGNCDFDFFHNFYQKNSIEDSPDYSYSSYSDDYLKPKMTTFKPCKDNGDPNNNPVDKKTPKNAGSFPETNFNNINANYNNVGRISRSSSKRSLENFHAYVEENLAPITRTQRSNSFVSNEFKCKFNLNSLSRLSRSNSLLSDCSCMKDNARIISYNNSSSSPKTSYFDDLFLNNVAQVNCNKMRHHQQIQSPSYSASVPDFKKIFISEYL